MEHLTAPQKFKVGDLVTRPGNMEVYRITKIKVPTTPLSSAILTCCRILDFKLRKEKPGITKKFFLFECRPLDEIKLLTELADLQATQLTNIKELLQNSVTTRESSNSL